MSQRLKAWVVVIILFHTAINVLHGGAHVGENVRSLTLAQILFITIVIFITPLVALFLLGRTRWLAWGGWWFFLSMLGSLLFGVWYHFVVPGADNIASLSPGVWKVPFQLTSILLTVIDAGGTLVGALFFYRVLRLPDERAKAPS
jgi:hypothetical protein